jgi:hypothetical protein
MEVEQNGSVSVDQAILQAVRNIRFGSVEVVIQDGRVVQIESREKVRFKESKP